MTYIDMICRFPWPLPEGAELPGAHTPPMIRDGAALSYMRLTEAEAQEWRAREGVAVLAVAPVDADPIDPDAVYAALFADPEAAAAYAAIYPREPFTDEDGIEKLPPERIGQVG